MTQDPRPNDYLIDILACTSDIVSARVQGSDMGQEDIVSLIETVHAALIRVSQLDVSAKTSHQKPFVPVERSIQPDYLVCLEDGRKMKMLRRHLRTHYNMTPEEYREKWGLPPDYPMTAPNYAKKRSSLAKDIGLGKGNRKTKKKK